MEASTGRVIGINQPPGQKGTLNFDLVRLRPGEQLAKDDILQTKIDMTFDAKFGATKTNKNQAAFAPRHGLSHWDLQAGNFRIKATLPAGAPPTAAPAVPPSPASTPKTAPVAPKQIPPNPGNATPQAPTGASAQVKGFPPSAPALKPLKPNPSAAEPKLTGSSGHLAPVNTPRGASVRPCVLRPQGGQMAGQAATGLVQMVLQLVAQRYIQSELDKKNVVAFDEKLKAQQPRIEQMIASQLPVAQRLDAEGRPAFANITLFVKYQSDVSGELGGGTVFMGLEVRKVEISPTRIPYVTTGNVPAGFFEYALKQQLGMSETLLSFSVSYPEMRMASDSDPTTGPPPNCFIATACYGSPEALEVQVLREFRDGWLARFTAGRIFIRGYYVASPPFARWLEHHSAARRFVRHRIIGPIVTVVAARNFGDNADYRSG